MIAFLVRVEQGLAAASRVVASLLLVALMLIVAATALGRYTGLVRIPGGHELSGYLLVALVYVGLAAAFADGRLIQVELVHARASRAMRRGLDLANHTIALLVSAVLAIYTWGLVVEAYTREIRTIGELRVPLFPLYGVMEAGLVLLTVQVALGLAVRLLRGASKGDGEDRLADRPGDRPAEGRPPEAPATGRDGPAA